MPAPQGHSQQKRSRCHGEERESGSEVGKGSRDGVIGEGKEESGGTPYHQLLWNSLQVVAGRSSRGEEAADAAVGSEGEVGDEVGGDHAVVLLVVVGGVADVGVGLPCLAAPQERHQVVVALLTVGIVQAASQAVGDLVDQFVGDENPEDESVVAAAAAVAAAAVTAAGRLVYGDLVG